LLKQTLKSEECLSRKATSKTTTSSGGVGVSTCKPEPPLNNGGVSISKDEPSTIIIVSAYSLTSSAADSMFHTTHTVGSTTHVSTARSGAPVKVCMSQSRVRNAESKISTVMPFRPTKNLRVLKAKLETSAVTHAPPLIRTKDWRGLVILPYFV